MGIEQNQGQLRLALICICGKLDQLPITIDVLAEMMDIHYGTAETLMARLRKDGMVVYSRGRYEVTEKAYTFDLVGGQL